MNQAQFINGYVRRDQFNSDLETGSHTASFELTTIQGVNENKYNFSVSLEAAQTVDAWWKYPSWLTPTRAVHHFFKWHSNLLEIADVIGLNWQYRRHSLRRISRWNTIGDG
jgi:hypothetical protein